MDEIAPREPLLTPKGRLADPCWAVDDIFAYNKERIRYASRRQEWEFYQAFNDRFAFQVYYGHGPGGGKAEAVLVDFETGERVRSGKRLLFCGDTFDLDYSPGEPHASKYEDETLFLSIGYDGAAHRVLVRSDRLDAEFVCPNNGEAVVTAAPFSRRTNFLYQYKKIFPSFTGHVHMHKLDYPVNDDTVMLFQSARGVLPYQTSRIWAAAGVPTEEGFLALNLGEDYGPEGAPTENALFLDGVMEKLGKVYFKFKPDSLTRRWHISDGSRRIHLEFSPEYDNYQRTNYLAIDIRRHQLFGRLNGTVRLSDDREVRLSDSPCFVEQADERR